MTNCKPVRDSQKTIIIMNNLLLRKVLFAMGLTLMLLTVPTGSVSAKNPRQEWQQISVTSSPSGAKVILDGQVLGVTPCTINVPVIVDINKKYSSMIASNATLNFKITKSGYEAANVSLRAILTNKNTAYCYQSSFAAELTPTAATIAKQRAKEEDRLAREKDPTITAGEAQNRVSRDKAGQSELERTIIRWFFDSDPQGARIFYRVISSVPAEVKNTNETYLMTTPFEETRSFNILGLTYENSRDVQIEIKMRKRGYEDQIKRYNVRQAIDQQEISGFFELVKKEEREEE